MNIKTPLEKSACGVGFVASRNCLSTHDHLQQGLQALKCVEHRGACGADRITGDGSGIMTDIPFELFGIDKNTMAVATLFFSGHGERRRKAMAVFTDTLSFLGLEVTRFRDVPINPDILGPEAKSTLPDIKQAFIKRPDHCRTDFSFDKLLHSAKQLTRIRLIEKGIYDEFFFVSLSSKTIVYKALTRSEDLDRFYLDLQNPAYKTRFTLFHRRFSTNTHTSWDKAQPFRLIGHNGEINTIAGNRSWMSSREKSLGARDEELATHYGISDSGSLNEMVEALRYRSSIPHIEDILAIMIPPANQDNDFYKFWSRAMEPWDGPAFISYADGETIGARLDRNGFRPCRWAMTKDHFYLSSEAGSFQINESDILSKGTLNAGTGVAVHISSGEVMFRDPSHSIEHRDAVFDARLRRISSIRPSEKNASLHLKHLFSYTDEEFKKILIPMIKDGKEPIGSMGDTARLAIFSDQPRSFFDYFYQNFAQVTNPPLDYIREKMVTDLQVYLGKKPNIFEPKELIPPTPAFELKSPLLSLGQMKYLRTLIGKSQEKTRIVPVEFAITFDRSHGTVGLKSRLSSLAQDAVDAALNGHSVIILSDRSTDYAHPPIPTLIALRTVVNALNDSGLRLKSSIIVDSGEIKNTHDLAALIGFGATAVCPYLAFEIARFEPDAQLVDMDPDEKEENLIKAFENGLLKIMAKSGISVVRSYQSSKLFSAIGIGPGLIHEFFRGLNSPIGGIELDDVTKNILKKTAHLKDADPDELKLLKTYQFKEHNKGLEGEKHSMTNTRSKIIHSLVRDSEFSLDSMELYDEYLKNAHDDEPVNLRHLFKLKEADQPLPMDKVQPRNEITKTFGSGAMSFGAISAETQRDIFRAMKEVGGRSNSGEGGENPYFYTEGVSASVKQVASGRFGVTAEYLMAGNEIQIKIAQGAKPGEGGQLMSVKVDEHIAKARHSNPGIDLISPPPLHDIYSIEDLKELIYELKQLNPETKVNVKLVSGANIGTIAVGVAKAGADVIHVSGGDGGTGAATLMSMKHAGLPWELGVIEVHKALVENNLRSQVALRTDGGLSTGRDIVMAAIFGAEEFEFGKLLLIADGCIMARICEKNTCPTGIATHDPKFKSKYKGKKEHIVRLLNYLAEDIRRHLSSIGVATLQELIGRTDLISINPVHETLVQKRKLDLNHFFDVPTYMPQKRNRQSAPISPLNQRILADTRRALETGSRFSYSYPIQPTDRATLATFSGKLANLKNSERIHTNGNGELIPPVTEGQFMFNFRGSAGQGFGVFLTDGTRARLIGEANDSVCKSMSGGKVVIIPPSDAHYKPEESAIIGNCALYGATGGTLYVYGSAGDRFAVRNSGATAVVESTGLHACEYMTNGQVVILGETSQNLGAGMTGGELFIFGDPGLSVNEDYIGQMEMTEEDYSKLRELLDDYAKETASAKAIYILSDWPEIKYNFKKYAPLAQLKQSEDVMVE